jgi:hypothetical protein
MEGQRMTTDYSDVPTQFGLSPTQQATSKTGLPTPDLSMSPNVPRDMQALATALDGVTVPVFATTALRDAARSAGGTFQLCFVVDVLYRWRNSPAGWVQQSDAIRNGTDAAKGAGTVPNQLYWATDSKNLYASAAGGSWTLASTPFTFSEMTTSRTVGLNVPTGVWTQVGTWSNSSDQRGSEFGSASTGLTVATGGRYLVIAFAQLFGQATGGRRGITVGATTGVPTINSLGPAIASAAQSNNLMFTRVITMGSSGIITVWLYQDSGATLVTQNDITLTAVWLP